METVLAKVEALHNGHAEADKNHAEVDRLGLAWLAAGSLSPDDRARFRELVTLLADRYRVHIAVEERDVFPAAAAILETEERESIGREMEKRRGLGRGWPVAAESS